MERNPHFGNLGAPAYLTLYCTASEQDLEFLIALKKKWALERENLLAEQKQASAQRNYERAKELKPAANELLQLYRAACLFIGHLAANPPGDCPHRPLKNWGVELSAACRVVDQIFLYGERGTSVGVAVDV